LTFFAVTQSVKGFRDFVNKHFVVPKSFKIGATIAGHALIPAGKPIFPGDVGYRKNLRKVDR
jgi:hypothetical protein